jgi:hypothetical protein
VQFGQHWHNLFLSRQGFLTQGLEEQVDGSEWVWTFVFPLGDNNIGAEETSAPIFTLR